MVPIAGSAGSTGRTRSATFLFGWTRFNDRVFDLTAIGLGSQMSTQEAYTEVLEAILERACELQDIGPEQQAEIEDVDDQCGERPM